MKKYTLLLALLFILQIITAQEVTDFTTNANTIKILNLESNTLSNINKIEAKETKVVQIDKSISQEDFDKICAKLKWIKKLSIDYDNPSINNILSISTLTDLESLKIRNLLSSKKTPVDLLPLTKLILLKEIDFYGTIVSNTDALQTLINLEKVILYKSNVSSINFLAFTPLVKEIDLNGSEHTFTNYEPIKTLKKLRSIDIQSNTQATDQNLTLFNEFLELREINISQCSQITSLQFLNNANKLQEFTAIDCKKIVNFTALDDMIMLKRVNLNGTPIFDLSFVSNKTELKDLQISNTQISNLLPIVACINLDKLDISNTSISDISHLSKLTKLRKLNISFTLVTSLSAISNLIDLTDLDASNTKITDLTPLALCKKLANINISNSSVTDIKNLYTLDKIMSLQVPTAIPQAQIDAIKIRFPRMRIDIDKK